MNVPVDLKYSKTDEWIKIDGSVATIGISDFAQSQLSDIVFLEILLSTQEEVPAGKTCATVESVKAAADVTLPISGKVITINEKLSETPELINTDPYGAAWMIKLEIDPSTAPDLMDAAEYQAYCAGRGH